MAFLAQGFPQSSVRTFCRKPTPGSERRHGTPEVAQVYRVMAPLPIADVSIADSQAGGILRPELIVAYLAEWASCRHR